MGRVRAVAGTAAGAVSATARVTGRGTGAGWQRVRRGVRAQGAGESGLAHLIDLHAVNGIGDALVTVGLAGTLFFSVPVGQARPRVALYLLITMAPFALLAPVVGPTLDRIAHGRRYALATTMLARAFLAWVMAGAVHGLGLYPAAFGVLVLSKGYGVARSAAVPRLLPPQVSLVAANSRLTLAGLVCAAIAASFGAALGRLGPQWPLRLASVAFLAGMVLALRLPARADSDQGETKVRLLPARLQFWRTRGPSRVLLGRAVVVALRASAALRALSGFLILFLAFALRAGSHGTSALAGVVAGAAIGSFAGSAAGARLPLRRAHVLQLLLLLLAVIGCAVAVAFPGLPAIVGLAFVAGFTSTLAKLALDSVIQGSVAERVRNSAFARSETMLQLAWVAGGALGLVPVSTWWGLLAAGVGLAGTLVWTGWSLRGLAERRAVVPAPA